MRTWTAIAFCCLLSLIGTASGSCTVALVQDSVEAVPPEGGLLLFALSGCSISQITASISQYPAVSFTAKSSSSIGALVTASGQYSVSVYENGAAVTGSPFSVEVTPGPVVAANTSFYGPGLTTAVAGQPNTIYVVPKDVFGNNASVLSMSAVMAETSSSASADVASFLGGVLTFSATRSGLYRLSVMLASSTSTIYVPVVAAEADGSRTIVEDAWIAIAGVSQTFNILIRDRFGNLCLSPGSLSLSFAIRGVSSTFGGALSTDVVIQTSHSYVSQSTYSVSFSSTRAGFYQVNSMIQGRSGISILTGQVINAPGCASLSFVTSFPQNAVAGSSFSAVIQMVDEYGNQATQGTGSYKGFVGDSLCSSCPSLYSEGIVSIEFILTVSATYSASVKVGDVLVSGMPLEIFVSPIIFGQPSAALYSVSDPNVTAGGSHQIISLFLLDRFGNIRRQSSDLAPQLVTVHTASNLSSQPLSSFAQSGGAYRVAINAGSAFTVSGTYRASVSYSGSLISTDGPSWNVEPSIPSATFSTKSGKGAFVAIVSTLTTFSVTLRDRYANTITQSGFSVAVSLLPPFLYSVSDGPAGSGIVIVTYSTNASGIAPMSCLVHGSNIIDSPSNVYVQASGFSASRSLFLTNNVVAVAGSSFGIDLAVSDPDGNLWVVNPFSDSSDGSIVADVKITGPSFFPPVQLQGVPSSTIFRVPALFTRSGQYSISADIVYTKPAPNGQIVTLSGSSSPQFFVVGASSAVQDGLYLDGVGTSIGTAGLYSQFHVHTFDSFGNLRTNYSNALGDNFLVAADVTAVSLSGTSITASIPGIRGQPDGTYAVIYRYTLAGHYKFSIRFQGNLTQVSTVALLVPGFAFGSMSSVTLSSTIVTAGTPTTFIVSAVDKYGNVRSTSGGGSLSVSIPNVPSSLYEYSSTESASGAYTVTFIITRSGGFSLNLFLNESPINGNPFSITVVPSFADPVFSTLVFQSNYAVTAGIPTIFDISSSDRFSNIKSVGGEKFLIIANRISSSHFQHLSSASVVNGTCTFSDIKRSYVAGLLLTIAGNYSVSVKVGEALADIKASPFLLTVDPNILCASQSIATGQGLTLVTSGISSPFTITSRDTYGNDLAQSISPVNAIISGSNIANFVASTSYLNAGRFVGTFTATVSGSFSVSVSLIFNPIRSSPIPLRVVTALACAGKSGVFGSMLTLSTAGSVTRFSICAKDQFSNMLTAATPSFAAVATSSSISLDLQTSSISGCEHVFSYTPTVAGTYSIGISVVQDNGIIINQPTRNSPFTATILASSSSPSRSIVSIVPPAVAGLKSVITIRSRDVYSNFRSSGLDSVSLNVTDSSSTVIASAVVADIGTGTYEASFLSTLSGTFSIQSSMQTPAGISGLLNNSGTPIVISPNILCATTSVLAVFSAVTAGVSSQFSIFARDRYGNARPGNSSFASLFSTGALSSVNHLSGNLYTFVPAFTASGAFSVFIKYDSFPVGSSPIILNVLPGFISAPVTLVSISSTVVLAGASLSFRIISRDSFGNLRSLADASFEVSATSSFVHKDSRLSTSGGVYSFELSMTVAALYQLNIVLNGTAVASSPYGIRVDPSVAEISRCVLIGNSFGAATAGKSVDFVVQVNDLYSNRITLATTDNLLLFVVQVASPKVSFLAARPSRTSDSFYEGRFVTTVSASYAVSISYRGKHISNSPFPIEILPSLVCRTLSYVTTSVLRLATAGMLTNFSIVALDMFSNQLSNGGLTFRASITPVVSNPVPMLMSVVDSNDGTYAVTFLVTSTGQYSSSVSMCLVDGCSDLGKFPNKSPFRTTVIPGAMDPTTSFLTGEGFTAATAAIDSMFLINLNDASGNFIGVRSVALLAVGFASEFASSSIKTLLQIQFTDSAGNTFSVMDKNSAVLSSSKSATSALGTVRNEPDGTVKVTYNVKTFGALRMRVSLNGIDVRGSPFNLTVFPLDLIPNAAKSSLATPTLPAATAGFPGLVKLTVRNQHGIGMISGNTVAQVFSSLTLGPISVLLRQIGVSSSSINIGFLATVAGKYKFSIRIGSSESNAQHISGSPFDLVVSPSFSTAEGSVVRSLNSIAAGSAANFTIEARDQFSNTQDSSKAAEAFSLIFTSPSGSQTTQSAVRTVGAFYQGQFIATLAGTYEVDVSLFGASITNAPFTVMVSPSTLAVENSVISDYPSQSVAGSRAIVSVSARDTFGNKLAASDMVFSFSSSSSDLPLPGPIFVSQSYAGSGEYRVSFVASVAGVYSMILTLPVGVIQPSFQTIVLPTSASPLFSRNLTTLSRSTSAGISETWRVHARDSYDNAHTTSQSAFVFEFSGPTSGTFPFSDLQDGTYERVSVFTSAGVYSVSIMMDSTRSHISGSPFSVRVSPNSAYAQSCSNFGVGVSQAGSGVSSSFSIFSFDKFGNKISRGGDSFVAILQLGNMSVSASVEDKFDGSYDVMYLVTAAATYSLRVLLDGHPTAGSPFNVSVSPHTACVPRLSYQYGSIIPSTENPNPLGITGDTSIWTIQTLDKFGNNRTSGGDFVEVSLTGPSFFNADVQDLDNGQYVIVAVVNAPGSYTVRSRISGQHIASSPLRGVQFAASGAGYDSIITSGNGISSAVAGAKLEVFIDASAPAAQKVVGSNKFRVKFVRKATGVSSVPVISAVLPSGLNYVSQILTFAGAYSVDVRGEIDFRSVANSPFALTVQPGALSPSACDAIGGGSAGGISGSIVNAFVRLRDQYGNVISNGESAEVTATLSTGGAVGVVQILTSDLQVPDFAGFYKITYVVPAGASSLSIFVSGIHIQGSPFPISGVSSTGNVDVAKAFFVGFDLSRPVPASRACTFSLYFRDASGMSVQSFNFSLLMVSASGSNQRIDAAIVASFSNFAVLSLAITKVSSGGWALAASYKGQNIVTTDRFNIFAVDVSPRHSIATSSDQNCSPAGCQARDFFSWEIQATDMYQNVITKSLGSSAVSVFISMGSSPVVSAILDNQDGSYSMQYTGTVAGTYSVSILINAAHILGSPFSTMVLPAAPSSTASFLTGAALATMTAGKISTLFMNVRDSFGNMYNRQLFNLNAKFGYLDLSSKVAYTSDGTYEAVFTATFASSYSLSVAFSPDPLSAAVTVGKPVSVVVLAALMDPSQTVTSGPGLSTFRAGANQPIQLYAYDAFGNLRSSSVYSDKFALSFSSSSNEYNSEAIANTDGSYTYNHASSIAGIYIISITNQATAATILRSPFSVEVLPGDASPFKSSLSPTASIKKSVVAGQVIQFGVIARDEFGSLTNCGSVFRVTSQTLGQPEFVSQSSCSEGVYSSTISPTVAGPMLVNVFLSGVLIVDAPFTVLVSAGPVDPSRCTAFGAGLLTATSGITASINIQTSDSFGNKCIFDPFGEVISFVASFVPSGTFSGPCINGDANDAHLALETGTYLCVDSKIVNNQDSTYTLYYTPWFSSTYDLGITSNSIGIADSPFGGLKVSPGPAYAKNFNVTMTSALSAGNIFGVSVLVRDSMYNPILTSLSAPDAAMLRRPVHDEEEKDVQSFPISLSSTLGLFQGSLIVTRAAAYSLSVSFDKILAGSGTISVLVSPGAISIPACTVSGNVGGGHVSSASTFLIIARDAYGNQISSGGETFLVSVSGTGSSDVIWSSDATGQPSDNSDGTYSVSYAITRRGSYSVVITSGSTSISASPMAVTFVDDSDIISLSPVAARSRPFGDGLYTAVVNKPSFFDLRLSNIQNIHMWTGSFKDNVVATLNLEFSNLFIPLTVFEKSSSLISFSYTISMVGDYTLSITLFGDHVMGSPYRITAKPSATVSEMTLVSSNAGASGTAGSLRTFSVSPRDASGNLQLLDPYSGPDNFAAVANLQGSSSVIIHASFIVQDDGFQIASWSPTIAGVYSLSVIHGVNVVKSLPTISILPGTVAASTTVVSGPGIGKLFIGSLVSVDIVARDLFGNLIVDGQQNFRLSVTSNGNVIASGNSQWNLSVRRYAFSYLASVIGALQVSVSLVSDSETVSVPGSPFVAESLVGPSCASLSTLVYVGSEMVAGQNLQFKVITADDFGNPVSVGGNFFRVTVTTRSSSFSPVVIDNLDGSYSTSFQVSSAERVNVTAIRNGFHVSGSPFSAAVVPGPASGPRSMINVQTPSLIAGESFKFSVTSTDRFGNALSTGGSIVTASLIALSTGATIVIPVTDRLDGTYSGTTPLLIAGSYSFGATLANIPIQSGASFPVLVTPSFLDTYRSTFSLSLDVVTADNSFLASLYPVDAFGNKASYNGEEISVNIYGGSKTMSEILLYNDASSVFSATLSISKVGSYSLHALAARPSGGSVSVGSPSNISVIPGADAPEYGRVIGVIPTSLVAGEFSAWVLQSMDKFQNPVVEADDAFTCALVCESGCGISPIPGVALSQGRKVFNITTFVAGIYNVHITLGSRHVIGSPFEVSFLPAAVSVPKSSVSGFALRHAFPGQPTRFQVNLRDRFANSIKNPIVYNALQVSGAASFAINFDESCSCALVTYVPPSSSSFSLEVSFESNVLSTSTIAVNNNPQGKFRVRSATGYASPTLTSATGSGLIFATVGQASTFYVTVKDGSNNLLSANVIASLGTSSTAFSQTQLGAGSMSLSYVATFSGAFPLSVRLDSGAHVIGSPFTVVIQPSIPSATKSIVTGANTALAGTIYTASLACFDDFGNVFGAGGFANLSGSLVGPSTVPGSVIDDFTGSASFQFPVADLGVYTVSIIAQGVRISSTFQVEVLPGVVASAASVALPLSTSTVVGGDQVEFYIEPRDKFGNVVASSPSFLGRLKGQSATALIETVQSSQPSGAGLHSLKYNVTVSGQYSLAASFLSVAIRNSPILFQVVPSSVSAKHSIASGLGTALSVKGSQSSFSVTLRDSFSNVLTDASLYQKVQASLSSRGTQNSAGIIQYNSAGDVSITASAVFFFSGTYGYTLPMDGPFILDVHFAGSHLLGSPFSVKSIPAQAPRIISSLFTDTVSGISIQFDVPTNQANMILPGSCSSVFISDTISYLAANPADARCSWSSPTQLNVFLGFGAKLVAGQRVSFVPGAISIQKSEFPPGSGQYFVSSNAVSVSVAVDRPKNPPAPIPVIKSPTVVSDCDVVVLDASSSAGSGGRPLQFIWGILPAPINDVNIRSFMRGFFNNPVATLPASLLPGGYSYTFMVRVTNFLDVSTDSQVSIQKVASSVPTVVIEGGASRSIDSSSVLRIKAQVIPSSCGPAATGFTFEWKWLSVSPSGPLPALDQETFTTPQLYIEKNTLIPGRTYVLGFYAAPFGSNSSAGSSEVTLSAKSAPLLAIIDGSHRVVSITDDVVLDGSRSIDFDSFSSSNFSYSWSCLVGGLPCFPSAAALFDQDVDVLRIPFSYLSPGSYEFRLTVTKDTRSNSVSAIITVTRGTPTRVGIAPITKPRVNADDKITLQAMSFEPSATAVSYEWSQISGENVIYVSSSNRTRDAVRVRSSLDAPMLVLSPFALQPGQSYGFRLSGLALGQQLGVADIYIQVNAPPSSGSFAVSPLSGRALMDPFFLQCKYWEDSPEDLPLKYEFRYLIKGTDDEIPILSTDKNSHEMVMPLAAAGPQTLVIAYIFDSWGASSRVQRVVNISVAKGGRRLMASQAESLKQSIASALAVGSCEDFLGSLTALASIPGASVCPYATSMRVCSAKPPASAITTALHSVKSLIDAAQGSCSKEQDEAMVSVMTSLSASASAAGNGISSLGAKSMVGALGSMVGGGGSSQGSKVSDSVGSLADALTSNQVAGEDSSQISSASLALQANKASAADLNSKNAVLGCSSPGAAVFTTPPGMLNVVDGASVSTVAAAYTTSPFASNRSIGSGVSSLSFGDGGGGSVPVEGLAAPIVLLMPLTNAPSGNGSSRRLLSAPGDGTVETCRYFNHRKVPIPDWDGEGCIAVGFGPGQLVCHCFHLTEFGSASDQVVPEMNTPDPVGDAKLFTQINMSNALALIFVSCLFFTYCVSMWLGWRADNRETDAKLNPMQGASAQAGAAADVNVNDVLNSGDFLMMKRLFKGNLAQKLQLLRQKFFDLVSQEHLFLSCIWKPRNSVYTRPRRITVLFCIIIGNMAVGGLFAGTGQTTILQTIMAGVISSLLMFPPSFIFAYLFRNIGLDRRAALAVSQDNHRQQEGTRAVIADSLNLDSKGDSSVLPPPEFMRTSARAPRPKDLMPSPDVPAFRGVAPASSRLDNGKNDYRRVAATSSELDAEVQEGGTGTFIPRRALPISLSSTPRASSYVVPARSAPAPARASEPAHSGDREMHAMQEAADTSKDPLGEATGIMRIVYKGSEAALRAISSRQSAGKRQQPLPSPMVIVAYTMAALWMLIAMYFSIIFGLKFPSAQSRSWVMAFGISLIQDMVVQQSIRVAAKTTISLVVMPRIAAFLAGRILNAYRKPESTVRRPAAAAN